MGPGLAQRARRRMPRPCFALPDERGAIGTASFWMPCGRSQRSSAAGPLVALDAGPLVALDAVPLVALSAIDRSISICAAARRKLGGPGARAGARGPRGASRVTGVYVQVGVGAAP